MDYEKKYKEALERARQFSEKPYLEDSKGIVDYIFPELKESEGEKIRKEIISALKFANHKGVYDKHIAWLEKQGEHANFRNKIQIGDKVTRNEDGMLVNLSQLNRVAKKDEKQGKNNMGISEATKQKLEDNLNKALEKETPESWNEFLDEQGEQKPAEDIERKYNPCYNMSFEEAQEYISNRGFDIPWTDCDVFVDFRYVTQTVANILRWADDNTRQKSAWSEEDELIVAKILCICNDFKRSFESSPSSMKVIKEDVDKIDNWLKSIKERYTWKPSDEQIKALNYVVNLMASSERPTENDLYYNILKSLRQQLKKLRGE